MTDTEKELAAWAIVLAPKTKIVRNDPTPRVIPARYVQRSGARLADNWS